MDYWLNKLTKWKVANYIATLIALDYFIET